MRWLPLSVVLMSLVALSVLVAGCPKKTEEPISQPPNVGQLTPPPGEAPPPAEKPAGEKGEEKAGPPKLVGEEGKEEVKTASGLKYIVLEEGKGAKPKKGAKIVAEYTGWLTDGTKFDSSKDRPGEFSFNVGKEEVIKGWDEALLDMKEGERRKLIIPPDLAYGDKEIRGGDTVIPPNSTLIFEVKLVKIVK